jgi:hypothetical protein
MTPIQVDADRYSTEVAASRYVKHPCGVPQPTEHCLILGPRGSGKTIMLKALFTDWRLRHELLPVYIELQPSIAKIAGELPLYGHEPLSPRDRAMLDCMSLAVSVALVNGVASTLNPESTIDALKLFSWYPSNGTLEEWTLKAHNILRSALVSGIPFNFEMPPVSVVASTLGDSVLRKANKTLVLLVDQIDQVPAPVFRPIVSLLKRTSSYTTIMASRPCPTAPEQAIMPNDVVAGETYQVMSIDPECEIERREALIISILQKLPFLDDSKEKLFNQSRTLASLTWPSLRLAIQICQVYEQLLLHGNRTSAWQDAIVEVSHRYEDVVKDGLRAWCANPSHVLREWRKNAIEKNGTKADHIIRATLRLVKRDLFACLDHDISSFFRVALKHGILFPGTHERYVLDQLPDSFEIGPLLLVTDTTKLSPERTEVFVEWEVHQGDMKRWVKPSFPLGIRTKRIFVSYWMSDPLHDTSEVAKILKSRLLDTVAIVMGEIHGSPQFSPKILEKVQSCNLILCDLTTRNRNIFVEYGWAIGLNKPVVQVAIEKEVIQNCPSWLTARQFQFYKTEEQQEKLSASVIRLLNEPIDRVSQWIYEPPAIDMAFRPKPTVMTLLGPESLVAEIHSKCADKIREYALELNTLVINDRPDVLFESIKRARKAGTLVLLFTGKSYDYLTCLAGGIFTTKDKAFMANRPFRRQLVLYNGTNLTQAEIIPVLLSTYPQVVVPTSIDQLVSRLIDRARTIRDWIASGNKRKTK